MQFLPLPRFAGLYGSTQPGPGQPDPDPAAPGGIPPGSAEPFPYEPGDIPQPSPGPLPGEPGYAPPPDQDHPKEPAPEREKVAARVLTPLELLNNHLLEENIALTRRGHRFERAFIAAMLAAIPTFNFVQNAISRLEPEDWRHIRDLIEQVHRQSSELAALTAPLCRKPVESPKLAVVS